MSHPRKSLPLAAAAACLFAMGTPVLAQDATAHGYSHGASKAMGKAAAKYKRAQVSEDAVAEVPDSGCHVEHWDADYISHPWNYHTMCGPR